MALNHASIAWEPGVCPEPPARQVGLLQWMRLVYKNPLAMRRWRRHSSPSLAMLEACLVLATIARTYRLRMVPGHPVEAQGWITLRPRHGLRMTLEERACRA